MRNNIKNIIEIVETIDVEAAEYIRKIVKPRSDVHYNHRASNVDDLFTWSVQPQGHDYWFNIQQEFTKIQRGIW